MPDPVQAADAAIQIAQTDGARVAEGTLGAIAGLGVLGKLAAIIIEWWGKRTAAKLTADTAAAELRAQQKRDDDTASHRAAELTLQLSDRQAKEVERAELRAIAAEGRAEAVQKDLHTCEETNDHLLGRVARIERDHAGCPGAAAFAELRGQYAELAEQNEWMENVITAFTGVTPPRKTMPAPARVADGVATAKHGKVPPK